MRINVRDVSYGQSFWVGMRLLPVRQGCDRNLSNDREFMLIVPLSYSVAVSKVVGATVMSCSMGRDGVLSDLTSLPRSKGRVSMFVPS